MISVNRLLNEYLSGERIPEHFFNDLRVVVATVGSNRRVLEWFSYLQSIEIVGWRPRSATEKIARMLAEANEKSPIQFYSLFCPSYKKGMGAYGFRTDDVGNTSMWGISILQKIIETTKNLGIACCEPRAIFFDIALEQPEKTLSEIDDLKKNIINFKKQIPPSMKFELLSETFPFLFEVVGYRGIKVSPLPVPQKTFDRIVERGTKFYKRFKWTNGQIKERSEVIASSEALVGSMIRHSMSNSIMVYTPTMLERAQVYSGHKLETDPLPIIFPQKSSQGLVVI